MRACSFPWTLAAFVALLLWAALAPSPALAVRADELLPDPALESRARDISAGLRCLVCQNQSIDDSDAPLARDLRLLVRERLKAGDDDSAVTRYVVERYGEFVLLKPVFAWHTALLWLAPLLVLLAGAGAIWTRARRAAPQPASPLSAEERAALERLTGEGR
jgi:cytochrome c-type biogenesis protein CcmH